LKEDPSEEIGEESEAKTQTEPVPTDATEEIQLSAQAEAVVPENEQGDSLLEKVAQSMEAVVVAAQETLLGTGEASSTDDADKDLGDEKKPVDEQDTTSAAPAPSNEEAPDPSANADPSTVISEQQEPILNTASAATEGVNPSNPAESSPAADPIYTIAIVGNKYNTQNFW
jgi:capping protein alpha